MTKISDGVPDREQILQGIATKYLELTRAQMDTAKGLRTHYAQLARNTGMTNQKIGDLLGVTEARVRQLLAVE